MIIREIVARACERLQQAGIAPAEARLDAELLARESLGISRAALLAQHNDAFPADRLERYAALIARREKREPVAYIRGCQEFYGRDFAVSPAVLIPRPETELIVDEALLLLPALSHSRDLTVIDIGTGSGCLAITLALEFPAARYIATDVSPAALHAARRNAERLGVANRIAFVHGSHYAGQSGPFNLIVANPPYIADDELHLLSPEVSDYEPREALFGGHDGLRNVAEILHGAEAHLDDDGSLLMEIGYQQLPRITRSIEDVPSLAIVRTRRDLQGIERMLVVRRRR